MNQATLNQPTPDTIRRLTANGWFWTTSLDFNGNLCRTLIKSGGLNDELPYAPLSLPIHQVIEIKE